MTLSNGEIVTPRWTKYKLGDSIEVTHKFVRHKKRMPRGLSERTWELLQLNKPTKAIVIGKRTLSDGIASWDSDSGWEYNPRAFMFALLVVISMKNKPFLIPYREQDGNDN